MPTRTISDHLDPRVSDFVGLRDGPNDAIVVVEGPVALDALVRSPFPIRSVLCLPKRLPRVRATLGPAFDDVTVLVAEQDVLARTVGFDLHRGIVASALRLPLPSPEALAAGAARRLVVVEGVGDLENLGALFRNAAAFGVDAVLLDPTTADPLYRRSVRVSSGHALTVPFARWSTHRWPSALGELASAGWTVAALTPGPGSITLDELVQGHPGADRPSTDRVALVVGAEGPGLSAQALAASTHRVRIPMATGIDSLNLAVATAVALYALGPGASGND